MKKMNRGKVLHQAILMAEDLFPEPKSGKKKKAWVVEFINSHVNMPLLSERQEEKIISFAVDMVCDLVFSLKK
jgi:hypothetical protein|tara:strand:- start:1234 stop:1452 length:219 start_codon:yes stop_codon:yes gene_type:complete